MNLVDLEAIECNYAAISSKTNQTYSVKGSHKFYHYNCDQTNDMGWGCGYRTLQTICSWIRDQQITKNIQNNNIERQVNEVPSILDIQRILCDCGDKPSRFQGSREWIGCFEASLVIDVLYDLPCRILHSNAGELAGSMHELRSYFKDVQAPIMMGGDRDNASKGILGICSNMYEGTSDVIQSDYLLVANPHYCSQSAGGCEERCLVSEGWIKWVDVVELENTDSFYNFCMPKKII